MVYGGQRASTLGVFMLEEIRSTPTVSAFSMLDTKFKAFRRPSCPSGSGYYRSAHWAEADTELRDVSDLPRPCR